VTVLSDVEIIERCEQGMITPYEETQVKDVGGKSVISYGVSSYGYDIRLASEYKVYRQEGLVLDPKCLDSYAWREQNGAYCIIPANGLILGCSMETFDIPRDLMVMCFGKSTYARAGINVNITPLEPDWHGILTIEISNHN
jgi:dCTP deaminase